SIISNYLHRYCDTAMLDALYRAHVSDKKNVTLFEGNGIFVYRRVKQSGAVLLFCSDPIMGDSNYEYTIPLGEDIYIDELGLTVRCMVMESTDAMPCTESKTIVLRYTGYGDIVVRNRRSGDTIFRKAGRRTLKRLYIDYKLTPEQKQKLPIIVVDNCVAAVLFDTIISQKPAISQTFLPLPHEKMLVIHYWYNHND
ncbi:MAG TPA: tRNA lysidine(34) synthetase TilS, partial [Spirochaetota bacterium]|nr:tRNA lysidine(34) synthetase TilS [Spirochaetota bacterium]